MKKWLKENLISLMLALFVVLLIRSSIIEPFKIPSGSMIPTLLIGDHIFVSKFAYGVILPFSDYDWLSDQPVYLIKREHPQHGDIIVFKYPRDNETFFIKRVIGIPGDTIEIMDKHLIINGKQLERTELTNHEYEKIKSALRDSPTYSIEALNVFKEAHDRRNPIVMTHKYRSSGEYQRQITVPPDHYFVMGDNRDSSNDSRFWGFVPWKNVRGKAILIWASFWFDLPNFIFRPERIGTVLR